MLTTVVVGTAERLENRALARLQPGRPLQDDRGLGMVAGAHENVAPLEKTIGVLALVGVVFERPLRALGPRVGWLVRRLLRADVGIRPWRVLRPSIRLLRFHGQMVPWNARAVTKPSGPSTLPPRGEVDDLEPAGWRKARNSPAFGDGLTLDLLDVTGE